MPSQSEMQALVDRLNEAARAYYTFDQPIMADVEYDRLYDQLLAMEKESGMVLPDSPTHRVGGAPLSAFEPHRHLSRLWSMDKVQSMEALEEWFSRVQRLHDASGDLPPMTYGIEYKFDGLTLNLTYDNGLLVEAATRGDGITGEAVLPQARTVAGVPFRIPWKGLIEVQGECIMRLSALEKYNQTASEPLKNARNAAAGALRNLDPAVTASRHLSAYFYQVGTITDPPYDTQEGMIDFLREQGFPTSPYFAAADSREAVEDAIRSIEDKRSSLDFLIDGAVIKIREQATRQALGYTDKFPRWAVAYKFEAEENTTRILNVTWELGRSGKLTPLAHVEPVDFAGVTVQKATLNNWGDIVRKKLKLGTRVWIRRSNDVIPEIMGCVDEAEEGTPIGKPTHCPACGAPLTERGANLFCLNRAGCKPQAVMRLKHFASRDAMDIETFSEKTADLFYDELGVRDPADLYHLDPQLMAALKGFGEKKVRNLEDALERSKRCPLDRFLLAIGIPNVGKRTARDLAIRFGTLDGLKSADADTLAQVDDIGSVIAESIVAFFSYPENAEMIDRLLKTGVTPEAVAGPAAGALTGQTVVVTGTLTRYSRSEIEQLIRDQGGSAASSVSKKTSFVVAGEKAGSKLDKARQLGIPVLTEEEFEQRLKGN